MNNEQVRAAALEEAAKLCDTYSTMGATPAECAALIRALATSAPPSDIEAIEHGTLKREAFANDLAYQIYLSERAAPDSPSAKAPCWSCNYHYTEDERLAADGNCPRCNVEIEVESAAPESGEM